MELVFAPKGLLQINDARICFRNFRGQAGPFNDEGDRSFHLVIPDVETAHRLLDDKNRYGASWNVKIKEPQEEGAAPFIHMPVKVKFTERSAPKVYLISGDNRIELNEDTIGMLDDIEIRSVDLDIRPYDGEARGQAFRSAYLQSIWVVQEVDRFAARIASMNEDNDGNY